MIARLKELHPDYTFEIVNFDTKGDQILNIALPKIGDKGLFTKELEDALDADSDLGWYPGLLVRDGWIHGRRASRAWQSVPLGRS